MYRLLERLREESIQTVRRSDFEELKGIVHSLGERVHDLANSQRRTELRVEELAEAQGRTEEEVRKLAKGLREMHEMVGGLSHTIGYGLEDRAFPVLPTLLQRGLGAGGESGSPFRDPCRRQGGGGQYLRGGRVAGPPSRDNWRGQSSAWTEGCGSIYAQGESHSQCTRS